MASGAVKLEVGVDASDAFDAIDELIATARRAARELRYICRPVFRADLARPVLKQLDPRNPPALGGTIQEFAWPLACFQAAAGEVAL